TYRQLSGAVSDDVTNVVSFKTSGSSKSSVQRVKALSKDEVEAYWQRRRKLAFMDAPREFITVCGTVLAFFVIVGSAQTTVQVIGLLVLTTTYMVQIFNNVS